MARCNCGSTTCTCVLTSSDDSISISGAGSTSNPYNLSAGNIPLTGRLQVQDTATVNLSLPGEGTLSEPFVLSGDASIALGDITDVDDSTPTIGYVLARQGDGTFALDPPSTAPVGAISVDSSLDGDGSGGDPLGVHDWANLARLAGADNNLPQVQDLELGSATDETSVEFRVAREAPGTYTIDDSAVAVSVSNISDSAGQGARISLEQEGIEASYMLLYPNGDLWVGSPGGARKILRQAAGEVVMPASLSFTALESVSFPAGLFSTPPAVSLGVTSVSGGSTTIAFTTFISSLTTSGMTVRLNNSDNADFSAGVYKLLWTATQKG